MRPRPIRQRAPLRALCIALVLLGPVATQAGMYRCVDAQGRLRFVDSPHACPGARPHALEDRLVQQPAASASAVEAERAIALAPLLLGAGEVAPVWELVEEAPAHPERDADLVAWGVVAQRTRHYTRDVASEAQVCSIELWGFASLEQARSAAAGFTFPGWEFHREGRVLVMTRGLRQPRQGSPHRGVFADCRALAARVHARAAAAAGLSPAAPDPKSGR